MATTTLENIGTAFKNNLTTGAQTKEGVLQTILDYFVEAFSMGITKLIVIIIPFIALFVMIDILVEYLRQGKDRSVNTLLSTAIQTFLNYGIIIVLADIWVRFLYKDLVKIVTQKLPAFLLGIPDAITIDRLQGLFLAPILVVTNVIYTTSHTIVERIREGGGYLATSRVNEGTGTVAKFGKTIWSIIRTGFSTLSDFIVSDTNVVLILGAAIFIVFICFKIMKLVSVVLFAYLFAGLNIVVSLGLATFNFIFASKTLGIGNGLEKILRIVVSSIAKFTVLILMIQVATSPDVPLSPIWTAERIAAYQDTDHNFNNPDTFYFMLGFWMFMLIFSMILKEIMEEKSDIL